MRVTFQAKLAAIVSFSYTLCLYPHHLNAQITQEAKTFNAELLKTTLI
jgi:hypothetical protein